MTEEIEQPTTTKPRAKRTPLEQTVLPTETDKNDTDLASLRKKIEEERGAPIKGISTTLGGNVRIDY